MAPCNSLAEPHENTQVLLKDKLLFSPPTVVELNCLKTRLGEIPITSIGALLSAVYLESLRP